MSVHLNHVLMEVLVKMVLTVINVHVCLDLMERIVKTVSVFYLGSFSLSLIIVFLIFLLRRTFCLISIQYFCSFG